jgi:hypothetical protein
MSPGRHFPFRHYSRQVPARPCRSCVSRGSSRSGAGCSVHLSNAHAIIIGRNGRLGQAHAQNCRCRSMPTGPARRLPGAPWRGRRPARRPSCRRTRKPAARPLVRPRTPQRAGGRARSPRGGRERRVEDGDEARVLSDDDLSPRHRRLRARRERFWNVGDWPLLSIRAAPLPRRSPACLSIAPLACAAPQVPPFRRRHPPFRPIYPANRPLHR